MSKRTREAVSISLVTARLKLKGIPGVTPEFLLDNLPIVPNDVLWDRIKTTYDLDLNEICALKNSVSTKAVTRGSEMLEEFLPPEKSDLRFPAIGIGSILFPRTDLVNKIIDGIILDFETSVDGYMTSGYYRGPFGSGKSVLTNLIAQELQNRGEKVYLFESPSIIGTWTRYDFKSFENSIPEGNRVFFILDEANFDTNFLMWLYLLKYSKKIITLCFGLPIATGYPTTPQFKILEKAKYILLQSDELTDDVVQSFIGISRASDPSIVPSSEQARAALETLLQYTGGHIYPFVKLSEYMFVYHADKIIADTMQQVYVEDPSFITTVEYQSIKNRCFRLPQNFLDAVQRVLTKYYPESRDVHTIDKIGYWDEKNFRILSNIYLSHFMRQCIVVEESPRIDFNAKNALTDIFKFALSNLREVDFNDPQLGSSSVIKGKNENSLSFEFGIRLNAIEPLFVTTQFQIATTKRGANPAVDIYINGRISTFIELIKDGSNLEEHFDRFEKPTGAYHSYKNKYVIFDFETKKNEPSILPQNYSSSVVGKYYCFVKSKNSLYCDGKSISDNVSNYLKSP